MKFKSLDSLEIIDFLTKRDKEFYSFLKFTKKYSKINPNNIYKVRFYFKRIIIYTRQFYLFKKIYVLDYIDMIKFIIEDLEKIYKDNLIIKNEIDFKTGEFIHQIKIKDTSINLISKDKTNLYLKAFNDLII